MRCVVSCGSTSCAWLVFFYGALVWGSIIHKHTGRWMWQGSAWLSYSKTSVSVSVSQWMVGYLIDNHVKDDHYYLMTVYTGLRRGAGTKSNVRFILMGDRQHSRVRLLSDGERVSEGFIINGSGSMIIIITIIFFFSSSSSSFSSSSSSSFFFLVVSSSSSFFFYSSSSSFFFFPVVVFSTACSSFFSFSSSSSSSLNLFFYFFFTFLKTWTGLIYTTVLVSSFRVFVSLF